MIAADRIKLPSEPNRALRKVSPLANALLGAWLIGATVNGVQAQSINHNDAQDNLCPAAPDFVYAPGAEFEFDPERPLRASADAVTSKKGVISLAGNTEITFQNRTILAENARYDSNDGSLTIDGELSFESAGVRLRSRDAAFNSGQTSFSMGASDYEINLGDKRATGAADSMQRNQDGTFVLKRATYSTCPPGDRSWYISAKDIELDTEAGIGTAKNITLRFKDVPVLAVPRFSFPISPKRKTGFLAPSLARGDYTGFELMMPWYWNILPQLDATFTPRLTTRRGAQLQTEVRYLNRLGLWRLDSEYLYDEDLPGEERDRNFTRLRHSGGFDDRWKTELDASLVSDKNYFEDLGDSLQVASITHLERRADLRYVDSNFDFLARLQSYQTVDNAIAAEARPYRRLPQLKLRGTWPRFAFGLNAAIDSELVYFDRDDSVTGLRFDFQPRLSLPINRDAWFFKPTLATRYSFYDLNNVAEGNPGQIDRLYTTGSIDAGLFFDRTVDNRGSVQTLEPRLFYLRVPFEDQQLVPVFDSTALDFNFSQLFRENRFSGADRIADANQLSLALTTRFIDGDSGRERLLGSIGQIFYFDDRRVSLEGEGIQTRDVSDFVAELSSDVSHDWRLKSSLQWNPDRQQAVRTSALISYRPDQQRLLNLGYRLVNTGSSAETEQLDFSILWPLGKRWKLAARWNYSLDSNTSIENLLGLEYEDCCWAFRFAARRFIADDGLGHINNYYFQLVLKGLAPLGQNISELLETGIVGYQDGY